MAGSRTVTLEVTPDSPEKIALDLLERVAFIESKRIGTNQEYLTKTDRKWLLDTYAECLTAAKGQRKTESALAPNNPELELREMHSVRGSRTE